MRFFTKLTAVLSLLAIPSILGHDSVSSDNTGSNSDSNTGSNSGSDGNPFGGDNVKESGGGSSSSDGSSKGQFGSSGQFAILPASGSGKWLKVKLRRLREIGANETSDREVSGFGNHDFVWYGPYYTMINGVNATCMNFTDTFTVDSQQVKFSLTTVATPTEVDIPYGNETITVTADSLKFSVQIENWPFQSESNSLTFGINVESKGQDKKGKGDESSTSGYKGKKMAFADGDLNFPTTAVIDGVSQNIVVNATEAQNGGDLQVDFVFPYFSSYVYYDPEMSLSSDSNAAFSQVVTWGLQVILLVNTLYFLL